MLGWCWQIIFQENKLNNRDHNSNFIVKLGRLDRRVWISLKSIRLIQIIATFLWHEAQTSTEQSPLSPSSLEIEEQKRSQTTNEE